jgi:hypothetical protein
MFEIAGGIVLAVLFLALLPLMFTKEFLAALITLAIGGPLFLFVALAPTDVGLLLLFGGLGTACCVQAAYVSNRDGASFWDALVRGGNGIKRELPKSWGVVPKSLSD